MIKLNEKAIKEIRQSRHLKNKLLLCLNISERTLMTYLADNSDMLTTLDAINVIVEHTQLKLSSLITGDKLSKLLSE